MAGSVIVALTNPIAPEQADAFQSWYTDTHLPQIFALTGIDNARVYRAANEQPFGDEPRYRFMVTYEVNALSQTIERLREAAPKLDFSEYFDPGSFVSIAYDLIAVKP